MTLHMLTAFKSFQIECVRTATECIVQNGKVSSMVANWSTNRWFPGSITVSHDTLEPVPKSSFIQCCKCTLSLCSVDSHPCKAFIWGKVTIKQTDLAVHPHRCSLTEDSLAALVEYHNTSKHCSLLAVPGNHWNIILDEARHLMPCNSLWYFGFCPAVPMNKAAK